MDERRMRQAKAILNANDLGADIDFDGHHWTMKLPDGETLCQGRNVDELFDNLADLPGFDSYVFPNDR